jgi:hypothetical protein
MERGRGQVMFLPRNSDSAVEGGGRSGTDMLVRFGEGCRLHGSVVSESRTCSSTCGVAVTVTVTATVGEARLPA